jgi:hypothetical protein
MSNGPILSGSEHRDMSGLHNLLKARLPWLLVLAVATTVVIEGFAFSWGGGGPRAHASAPPTDRNVSSPNVCASGASYRFIQIDYLRFGGGSQLATATGHVVKLHCGGPDDLQYLVQPTAERVSLRSHAKITLLTLEPTFYIGTLKELNDYLARDEDGDIFLVTGPDSGATALTAMFHP